MICRSEQMEPVDLNNLDKTTFREWLDTFDVILTDCDAVLWHDNIVIPQVAETINSIKDLGKQVYFVTNNGTKTRHDLWLKASRMNFQIEESHIIAPSHSIAEYLKEKLPRNEKVYVIGSCAVAEELNKLNIENFGVGEDAMPAKWSDTLQHVQSVCAREKVGAVVVGFDDQFNFVKLLKASTFLDVTECQFLATNADAVHKYPKYCIPGTGAILKALEACVYREATIMGKPNPIVCDHLIRSGAIDPKRTLMIGDCCKVDVVFGKNCGFQTLLVGTGHYKWPRVIEMLQKNEPVYIPDYYVDSLGDLYKFLS